MHRHQQSCLLFAYAIDLLMNRLDLARYVLSGSFLTLHISQLSHSTLYNLYSCIGSEYRLILAKPWMRITSAQTNLKRNAEKSWKNYRLASLNCCLLQKCLNAVVYEIKSSFYCEPRAMITCLVLATLCGHAKQTNFGCGRSHS